MWLCWIFACDPPEEPGTLEVSWRTGRLSCAEAGVETVRAELFDFGGAAAAFAAEAGCGDGALTVGDISPGAYSLVLKGMDPSGCWTHEARRDEVSVPAGDTVELAELPLLRRERPLRVRWPFANELDCHGNGVEQVQVTIDIDDRTSQRHVFACPGLAREIPGVPAGDARVTVLAFDATLTPLAMGSVTMSGSDFRAEPCADFVEVRVPMELCAEAGC